MRRALAIALTAAVLAACGTPETVKEAPRLRHVVRPDPELRHLDVEVRFDGVAPSALRFAVAEVVPAVADLRTVPSGVSLDVSDGRFDLPSTAAAEGVAFRVELAQLREHARTRVTQAWKPGVLVECDVFVVRVDGAVSTVRVETPPGVYATTPWGPAAEEAALPRHAYLARGYLALSPLRPVAFSSHGTRFEILATDETRLPDSEQIAFVSAAAQAVSTVWNPLPIPRVQVSIHPRERDQRGVYFGATRHGGGKSVALSLDSASESIDLASDWITTHELVHLMMPRIDRRDCWLSEGAASYYQELLRARAGLLTRDSAWRRLRAGFDRGRPQAGSHALEDDTENMRSRGRYLRVYWSGAAIAFLLDVELRRHHGRTLDDAMREATRHFGTATDPVRASEILEHLDGWLAEPVFTTIANRWLASSEFPDVDEALEWLTGDGAASRDAMMAPVGD